MVRIGMQRTPQGIGYFAVSARGFKTGLELGWDGLLKAIGDACSYEKKADALQSWQDERERIVLRWFLARLVEESLQLRAGEMPDDYGLLIMFGRKGGWRYSFTDATGCQASRFCRVPTDAMALAELQASNHPAW